MTFELSAVVADDHAPVLAALTKMVQAASFQVVGQACTWVEAADLAAASHPDIVLIDVNIPPSSSFDAIAPIRAGSPGSLIILISADSEDSVVAHQARLGCDGFISKLMSPTSIVEILAGIAARLTAAHEQSRA